MFTTIITDCKSENARLRQITRFNSLGLGPAMLAGVGSNFSTDATIEAAGNLIDALDASAGKKGVISVNVAPRGNKKEDGENGTSFSYFYYQDTLVISTIRGYSLSLIKKFSITKSVNLLNLKQVLDFAERKKLITKQQKERIVKSQFRSFDFVPHVTRWIFDKVGIPSDLHPLFAIPSIPSCIWCVDAFGNVKTTLTSQDLPITKRGKTSTSSSKGGNVTIKTNAGDFSFYRRLKDIPKGKTAIYIGSSGLGNKRFLEFATQGIPGSAASSLNFKVGDKIKIL